ncbi:MAG: YgiT-type zinc finger protein [Candidatus Omnitrophota bacterium]
MFYQEEGLIMQCELCRGRAKEKTVSYSLFYEGHWVIVEHVPAYVCQQCGEKTFAAETTERLQNIFWDKEYPDKKMQVPVFDMSCH